MKNKNRYKKKIREKAFRLYQAFEGNASKVSRELGGKPTKVTILQWAEEEDWDGKLEASKNVVREMLGINKDPMVKKLAKDDVFIVEVLSLLQGLAIRAIKTRRAKVTPKNATELVRLLDFVSKEYHIRTGTGLNKNAGVNRGDGTPYVTKATLRDILREVFPKTSDPENEEVQDGLVIDMRNALREINKRRKAETKAIREHHAS